MDYLPIHIKIKEEEKDNMPLVHRCINENRSMAPATLRCEKMNEEVRQHVKTSILLFFFKKDRQNERTTEPHQYIA